MTVNVPLRKLYLLKYMFISRFQSSYINGPGPQSEGLDNKDDGYADYKKGKPQYVTIRRQRFVWQFFDYTRKLNRPFSNNNNYFRPSKDVIDDAQEQEEEEEAPTDATTERFKPTYKTVDRTRYRDLGEVADENSESDSSSKYTAISRSRSTESDSEGTTSPKYVTLRRQRPVNREDEVSDEEIPPASSTLSTAQTPRYVSKIIFKLQL